MSGSHLSKDFFELVKAIGESKSKQVAQFSLTLDYTLLNLHTDVHRRKIVS
jgi:hypothetical protein